MSRISPPIPTARFTFAMAVSSAMKCSRSHGGRGRNWKWKRLPPHRQAAAPSRYGRNGYEQRRTDAGYHPHLQPASDGINCLISDNGNLNEAEARHNAQEAFPQARLGAQCQLQQRMGGALGQPAALAADDPRR